MEGGGRPESTIVFLSRARALETGALDFWKTKVWKSLARSDESAFDPPFPHLDLLLRPRFPPRDRLARQRARRTTDTTLNIRSRVEARRGRSVRRARSRGTGRSAAALARDGDARGAIAMAAEAPPVGGGASQRDDAKATMTGTTMHPRALAHVGASAFDRGSAPARTRARVATRRAGRSRPRASRVPLARAPPRASRVLARPSRRAVPTTRSAPPGTSPIGTRRSRSRVRRAIDRPDPTSGVAFSPNHPCPPR